MLLPVSEKVLRTTFNKEHSEGLVFAEDSQDAWDNERES
jgi:hypothetical protein